MKLYVNVPFSKKESAKQSGAKWDHVNRSWYFDDYVPPQYHKKINQKSFEERFAEAKKNIKKNVKLKRLRKNRKQGLLN